MKKVTLVTMIIIMALSIKVFAGGFKVVNEKQVEVITKGLNLRIGPSINHESIRELREGDTLNVLGMMDGWYLVELNDKTIGLVYNEYVKVTKTDEEVVEVFEGDGESMEVSNNGEEGRVFNLANGERFKNGIKSFKWDDNLNKIARLKAEDIAENKYLDHFSEKYGTPFKMLKQMNVEYITASENLAISRSFENAHDMFMASPAHRGNLLNKRFNKMGVGVCKYDDESYVIVQMFIEE